MSDTRTDDQKAKDVEKMQLYLASVRRDYENMVDLVITYVNHSRRRVTDQNLQAGQKTGVESFDGTAISAANICTDGMVGNLCSRNLRWFRFAVPGKFNFPRAGGMRQWSGKRIDEYPDVRRWLQDCEEVQYSALTRSNFYDIISEFVRDGVTVGTSHLISEEDVGAGRVNFTVPHFRECFIAENQYGRVDTNYRVYKMTLRQLADKFTYERMTEIDPAFKQDYESNFYAQREVIHAVYPRKDFDPGREDGKAKRIASIWVLRSPLKLIEEQGYDWLPTITWRWRKNNDEWYGRSPAWDAYVEIMKANQQSRTNLVAAHKMAEPPMLAPEDLRGQVQYGPNGQTFISGDLTARAPRPLLTGVQLPFANDALERTQKVIENFFAVPFFMALTMAAADKVEMTATQVVEMMGEKAVVLVTRIGMLEAEGLNPIHDRVFEIEARSGRMPEPPGILRDYAGARMEIQYLGMLAQAQMRLSKVRSIQSGLGLVTQVMQVEPTAGDVVDWDEVIKEAFDSTGFPESCMRDEEQVSEIRQQRQKEQQAQQQIEAMGPMSKILRAGKDKPEPGSPAQQILNPEQSQGAI